MSLKFKPEDFPTIDNIAYKHSAARQAQKKYDHYMGKQQVVYAQRFDRDYVVICTDKSGGYAQRAYLVDPRPIEKECKHFPLPNLTAEGGWVCENCGKKIRWVVVDD